MSSPIKAGDLVMVVRTCCHRPLLDGVLMGVPWRVRSVRAAMPPATCPSCGARYTDCVFMQEARPRWSGTPMSWLKKIDPPALLLDASEREELTA